MDEQENYQEGEKVEYVYGIPMPTLPPGLQPLEAVVMLQGIMLDTGQPTITAMGSEGMTPWMAVGMMRIEQARLEMGYTLTAVALNDDDDDEE